LSNVENLRVITSLDWSPQRILAEAAERDLISVVVIGETADGAEFFSSSVASGPEVLWTLERAKLKLLRKGD